MGYFIHERDTTELLNGIFISKEELVSPATYLIVIIICNTTIGVRGINYTRSSELDSMNSLG